MLTSGLRGFLIPSASGSGGAPFSTSRGSEYRGEGGGRFLSTVAIASQEEPSG